MGGAVSSAKRSKEVRSAARGIVSASKGDKMPVAVNKVSRILAKVAAMGIDQERQDWIKAINSTKGVGPKTRAKLLKSVGLDGG